MNTAAKTKKRENLMKLRIKAAIAALRGRPVVMHATITGELQVRGKGAVIAHNHFTNAK